MTQEFDRGAAPVQDMNTGLPTGHRDGIDTVSQGISVLSAEGGYAKVHLQDPRLLQTDTFKSVLVTHLGLSVDEVKKLHQVQDRFDLAIVAVMPPEKTKAEKHQRAREIALAEKLPADAPVIFFHRGKMMVDFPDTSSHFPPAMSVEEQLRVSGEVVAATGREKVFV